MVPNSIFCQLTIQSDNKTINGNNGKNFRLWIIPCRFEYISNGGKIHIDLLCAEFDICSQRNFILSLESLFIAVPISIEACFTVCRLNCYQIAQRKT